MVVVNINKYKNLSIAKIKEVVNVSYLVQKTIKLS